MIDFKRMYIDALVDCDFDGVERTLFFKGLTPCDSFYLVSPVHHDAYNNSEVSDCLRCKKIRISAKNRFELWLGGDCPVSPDCTVQVILRGDGWPVGCAKSVNGQRADVFNWSHKFCSFEKNIIAYRLLESPWQTIDGVCDE